MIKFGSIAVACAMVVGFQASAQAPAKASAPATVEPWKKIPIPPLHDFKPVEPKKIVLANGLTIFLEEDHELPFINGSILIRGGSRDEPAEKTGLVSIYGQTWRTSGTKSKSGDALDDLLAQKAASVETSGGSATTSLHWTSFKQDFPQIFALAMDLLLHPEFKADKMQLAKRGMTAGIARRNDDAAGIAGREAGIVAYGNDSPYARQVEYATLAAVQLNDLNAWHQKTVVPNNMIVSVSGDFDSATMEAELRKAFEPLAAGTAMPKLQTTFTDPKHAVYFVNKDDVNQSNVFIVGLGTLRNNPDYYALSVMNEIFSGGFGSRVFQDIRTKQGLAYSASGTFGASYDHPGIFYVTAATKSSTTVAATKGLLHEVELLKTEPPTPAEMKLAKDQVLNSFIFNYDSREKTLGEQVTLALYGYPPDFLDKYKEGIEKVTAADVTRVANKYIDASKLAIVVVGNSSEFGTPLSELGPVTNMDITIPPPPGAPAKGTKGSGQTGGQP
jgi:zinc protease